MSDLPPPKPKPVKMRLKTEEEQQNAPPKPKKLGRTNSGLIKVKEKSVVNYKKKPTMGTGRKKKKKKKHINVSGTNLPRVVSVTSSYVDLDETEEEGDKDSRRHDQRFMGTWESEDAGGMEGFMDELSLGSAFKKMAKRFGGGQKQLLTIIQDGDEFEITDSNERRELIFILKVGEKFFSLDEKGEKLSCYSSWSDEDEKTELIVDSINPNTNITTTVKRRIQKDGTLLEIREENHKEVSRRTYTRLGQF